MIFFPDKTMQRYVLTTNGKGVYGETRQTYVYADDILVDFQNESNHEVAKAYGVELQNLYKIYTDINTTINDTDHLELEGNVYHIIGNVKRYTKFHNYQKAHLILNRGVTSGN